MLGPLYSEGSMFSLMENNYTQCGGPYISVGVGPACHTYRAGNSDWRQVRQSVIKLSLEQDFQQLIL